MTTTGGLLPRTRARTDLPDLVRLARQGTGAASTARAAGREPQLRLTCADLAAGCDAQLEASSADALLLRYVQHAARCMHRGAPVELERVLGAVTVV